MISKVVCIGLHLLVNVVFHMQDFFVLRIFTKLVPRLLVPDHCLSFYFEGLIRHFCC